MTLANGMARMGALIDQGHSMDVEFKWFEELPEQCPPANAFGVEGFVCYRMCNSAAVVNEDFYSHRKLFVDRVFNVPECRARSVSVFTDPRDLDAFFKLQVNKNKALVKLRLIESDGLAMKTGKKSHYSWWRSKTFNPEVSCEGSL